MNRNHSGLRHVVVAAALIALVVPLAAGQNVERDGDRAARFVWRTGVGRGFLGVQVQNMTPELRVHFGVPEEEGVLVSKVEEGGPAEGAGILVGDIVTALDGESVESPVKLSRAIRARKTGDRVAVALFRDGVAMTLNVIVAERDREVLDLAEYRFIPDMDSLPDHDVFISRPGLPLGLHLDRESIAAFEEAMRGLSERFESAEWKEKLAKMRTIDLSQVEERMREVEERLKELEKELAKEGKKQN